MSSCNLDHTLEDVKRKLAEQREFLPPVLAEQVSLFLTEQVNQGTLNEIFHLLKKYDLSEEAERVSRNVLLSKIIQKPN